MANVIAPTRPPDPSLTFGMTRSSHGMDCRVHVGDLGGFTERLATVEQKLDRMALRSELLESESGCSRSSSGSPSSKRISDQFLDDLRLPPGNTDRLLEVTKGVLDDDPVGIGIGSGSVALKLVRALPWETSCFDKPVVAANASRRGVGAVTRAVSGRRTRQPVLPMLHRAFERSPSRSPACLQEPLR
jgi:hypothetical protein